MGGRSWDDAVVRVSGVFIGLVWTVAIKGLVTT